MADTMSKKVRYIKERCVNAYWMLRTGKFTLIFKSIYAELSLRVRQIRNLLPKPREVDSRLVLDSEFFNQRKVIPPSYRPTKSQPVQTVPLQVDSTVVAQELREILAAFTFQEDSSS